MYVHANKKSEARLIGSYAKEWKTNYVATITCVTAGIFEIAKQRIVQGIAFGGCILQNERLSIGISVLAICQTIQSATDKNTLIYNNLLFRIAYVIVDQSLSTKHSLATFATTETNQCSLHTTKQ